ncbi:MAG: N-acetylmuramoyl-L-alanine amidase [Flavobacteriales bacterium]
MPKLLLIYLVLTLHLSAFSQGALFSSAYQLHSEIPPGFLEAISYTHTRFYDISPPEVGGCSGIPIPFGIMGVYEDGHGYFVENGKRIEDLSGISIVTQKHNPSLQIEAYAAACANLIQSYAVTGESTTELIYNLMWELSEIPREDGINRFAFESSVLEVFRFLTDESHSARYGFPLYEINLRDFFGKNNFSVLTASHITIDSSGVKTRDNITYRAGNTLKSTNYGPALWNAAPSCNFSSRNGTPISAVTIHTVQGTYAGAISWGLNCNAQVSYHYVVRSSDGQVTQMVLESNKAWHVGNENSYTIGIEHEGYVSNAAWYTPSLYQSSANLVKDITQSGYGINPKRTYDGAGSTSTQLLGNCIRIKGHQHYANQSHTDPGINWNWNKYYGLINDTYTPTVLTNPSGTLYDSGGAMGNYSADERTVWLIQVPPGNSISIQFTAFDLESSFDKLVIYNGSTVQAPVLGTYTGNTLPPFIQSSGNTLTLEFRSDCATQLSGWVATYQTVGINVDLTPPSSSINYLGIWQTQSFTASFQDSDASGIKHRFYQVSSRASASNPFISNQSYGFFEDAFTSNTGLWTNQSGNFQGTNGNFVQQDASQNNSNAYAQVDQTAQHIYMYSWKQSITSTHANQRAGMHFFCSDPTLPNRGNSYFVYFREETDKVQLYKVWNDVFTLVKEDSVNISINTWDQVYVVFNPQSGLIQVYLNAIHVCSWTDANPLQQGSSISLRSGACTVAFDEVYVYRNHVDTQLITVGASQELYHQSDQQQESGKIRIIAMDSLGNWNVPHETLIQVDWTAPVINWIHDGVSGDIDSVYQPILEGNWGVSDPHSGVDSLFFEIGSFPFGNDIIQHQFTASNTFNTGPLGLISNAIYYTSLTSKNQAGMLTTQCSDGQQYLNQVNIELENPLVGVFLYPNPIQEGILHIENLLFPVAIEVFDLNGKIVYSQELTHDDTVKLTINTGLYLIKLSGNGNELIKQFVAY